MTLRSGTRFLLAWLVCALGCSGQSTVSSNGSSAGAGGATGGSGSTAAGEGGVTSGSGAADGSSGNAASNGDGATSGDGATTGGAAGGGAVSGAGGAGSAGEGAKSGGGNVGEGGDGGTSSLPNLSGSWGMFVFEDPVSVSFEQVGELLDGTGCCAGLAPNDLLQCCGPLSGTVNDADASFAFAFDSFGAMTVYGTEVTISEDQQRMGGTFLIDGGGSLKVAWVRFEGDRIAPAPDSLQETLSPREAQYELLLYSAFVGRFQPLEPYRISIRGNGFVSSDFGPFYWGEMSWDAAAETLSLGPVPATDPSFATELELRFIGDVLDSVVVTYPDDPPYFFSAERVDP